MGEFIAGGFVLAGLILSYILGVKKNNRESEKLMAETHKLNLESQEKEVEVSEKINEYYRTEMKSMLIEMAKLQLTVKGLSDKIDELSKTVEEKDKHIIILLEKCDSYERKLKFQIAAAKGCLNRVNGQHCEVLTNE